MTLCPRCQFLTVIYYNRGIAVECTGWNCAFNIDVEATTIISAAMAEHLRPLDHPHAYRDEPAYPGECGEIVDAGGEGERITLCKRPPEAHPMSALIIGGARVVWILIERARIERDRRGLESPCDCDVCRGAE